MIKAEQIPDEVVEAAARAIRQWLAYTLDKATPASELTDGEHEELARAACAAMLNAWPGGWIHEREGVTGKTLSFPLTQENNDD